MIITRSQNISKQSARVDSAIAGEEQEAKFEKKNLCSSICHPIKRYPNIHDTSFTQW